MQANPDTIEIRLASEEDDVLVLTTLLHRAYAQLGNMGLRYMAVDQPVEVTRKRMASGECYVALMNKRLVGTVLFKPPERTGGSPWMDRPDVAGVGQLAVDPGLQRSGLGSLLMDHVEARAIACGAREIALNTAEPAAHLRNWYGSRGYRLIEYAQWTHTNYRSVIMSKSLLDDHAS